VSRSGLLEDTPTVNAVPARSTAIKLVIFDCDGVLVDSESITNRVYAKMLNELGIPVTLDDMFEQFVGRSMNYCWDLVARMLGRPPPPHLIEEYLARTTAALQSELQAVPGIEETLDALEAIRVPYCVASSGTHEKMATTLGITGLLPRFMGRISSVTDVANAKPAPDVFLHAAGRNGVAPSACCVIEDSPTGVAAGVAAGMTVYGYCALTPELRLIEAGAHHTFSDMRRLPGLLFGHAPPAASRHTMPR
jgi:HAD superfamily hydrolase (TIGR01509 family)